MVYSQVLSINDRVNLFAEYMLKNKATVRAVAAYYGYSKSTVHKDLTTRLEKANPVLYPLVAKILDENKQTRHIRGGNATKNKYSEMRKNNDKAERRKKRIHRNNVGNKC